MKQGGEKNAGGQGLQAPESAGAEFPDRAQGIAHVHQPGLHEAFEPAGPLAQPIAELGIGLFVGEALHHAGAKAQPRQAQAQIRILGHIVGIPAADVPQDAGAKMIRRPAQGEGQAPRRKGRQYQAKERGIFGGELAAQPVFIGIVGGKLGLQAGQPVVRVRKTPAQPRAADWVPAHPRRHKW